MVGSGRTGASRRPTQADVASLAGVSPAIVSAVVNATAAGNIRVSDATRGRVQEAVRQLGYVPNIAARNLAGGRNHIIGIFSYESVFPIKSMNFYHEFLVGIEEEAEEAGYNLLMFSAAKRANGRRSAYSDGVNSLRLADGAVLVGTQEQPEEIGRLANERYPFVIVGRRDIPGVEVSFVAADYVAGARDAVAALVERGHRNIALIRGAGDHESALDRQTGFLQSRRRFGLTAAQMPVLRAVDGELPPDFLDNVLRAGTTAVITHSTRTAQAVRAAARKQNVKIPQQLSLLDLGGSLVPGETPTISTLVLPRREMGRRAVSILLSLLGDPDAGPIHQTLPCRLHLTKTVGPAN